MDYNEDPEPFCQSCEKLRRTLEQAKKERDDALLSLQSLKDVIKKELMKCVNVIKHLASD